MSISSKRKTPNPCQGKGLHGQELGEINYLASTGRTQYGVSFLSRGEIPNPPMISF